MQLRRQKPGAKNLLDSPGVGQELSYVSHHLLLPESESAGSWNWEWSQDLNPIMQHGVRVSQAGILTARLNTHLECLKSKEHTVPSIVKEGEHPERFTAGQKVTWGSQVGEQ